jgi:hypothetical protein
VEADKGIEGWRDKQAEAPEKCERRHDKESLALTRFLEPVGDAGVGGFREAFEAEWVPGGVATKTFSSGEVTGGNQHAGVDAETARPIARRCPIAPALRRRHPI